MIKYYEFKYTDNCSGRIMRRACGQGKTHEEAIAYINRAFGEFGMQEMGRIYCISQIGDYEFYEYWSTVKSNLV